MIYHSSKQINTNLVLMPHYQVQQSSL